VSRGDVQDGAGENESMYRMDVGWLVVGVSSLDSKGSRAKQAPHNPNLIPSSIL
jgi:hypothetical protein